MDEIDFQNADFDDIDKFTRNLLGLLRPQHPSDYEALIEYIATSVRVLVARRTTRSASELVEGIDQARSGIARGLEKLTLALNDASEKARVAAESADRQAKRMVSATWGLVLATLVLSGVTAFLVFYTRQLVHLPK